MMKHESEPAISQQGFKNLGKAVASLLDEYEKAERADHVHKPMSYALYQVWKKWNMTEKSRNE